MRSRIADWFFATAVLCFGICGSGCSDYYSASDLPGTLDPAIRAELPGQISMAKPPNWHSHDRGDILQLTSRDSPNRRIYGAKFLVHRDADPTLKFAPQTIKGKQYLVAREFWAESGDRAPHTQFHFQVRRSQTWQVTFIAYADLQEIPTEILPYVDSLEDHTHVGQSRVTE